MSVTFQTLRALILILGLGLSTSLHGQSGDSRGDVVIEVPGIPGPYCAYGIEKRLYELDTVQKVELDWEREEIRVILKQGAHADKAHLEKIPKLADYPYETRIKVMK